MAPLEKTPSKTKLFTIDMPGKRPDSAVSTVGINPSINSASSVNNIASQSPPNGDASGDSAPARGVFSTTIPIFRGPNSGHGRPSRPRSAESQSRERNPSGTEEGPEVPEISVKNTGTGGADSSQDSQSHPRVPQGSDLTMDKERDPSHLSPLINGPPQER